MIMRKTYIVGSNTVEYIFNPTLVSALASRLNPLSYVTEIINEIKQFNPGRKAFNPFIASDLSYMVFPLRDTFTIENALLD